MPCHVLPVTNLLSLVGPHHLHRPYGRPDLQSGQAMHRPHRRQRRLWQAAGLEMVEMVQMTEFYEDHRYTPLIAKLLEARKLDKGAVAECFDLIGLHTTYCFKKRS